MPGRSKFGAELFNLLLDHRLQESDAVARLADRGLVAGDCVVLSTSGPATEAERNLHLKLRRRGIPNLLVRRGGDLCALIPGGAVIGQVHRLLGAEAAVGVSDEVQSPRHRRGGLRASS
ncbi:hypothetical protein [Streptomyces sp. NPDC056190]|uniref:hypothetical protein n=1 Tax=Streptomyces sp. NPDC056190 TaxID=3345741 RepID=UPI0035E21BF5